MRARPTPADLPPHEHLPAFGKTLFAPADGRVVTFVGNRGAPQLHIQVQNLPKVSITLAGLYTHPILFRNVVVARGGEERTRAEADLRRGDRVRRAGD